MQSCAWMKNVQHRQVGPPSQSSQAAAQFTHNTTRNQQDGTANISRQYGTEKMGVRPPTYANLNYRDSVYSNRQPSNRQTSAVRHQAVCSQQTAKANNYHLKALLTSDLPCSSANSQSGYPGLPVTCSVQQDIHQNPTQCPSNMVAVNTTYPQQNMSANWNQSVRVQSMSTLDGNVGSDLQYYKNSLIHNLNVSTAKLVSAYTTTATSFPHEKETYTGTLVPAAPHNRQAAHNNNPRIHVSQLGSSPSSYNTVVSQSFRNNSSTTKSLSSGQNLLVSNMSLKNQQYMTTHNRGKAASNMNSNSYSRQYEASPLLSKTNGLPMNPAVDTQDEMWQAIARIEAYLRNPSTAGTGGCPPVNISLPHVQQQFGSEVRMMPTDPNMQPLTLTVTETYNLNAPRSLPLNSEQHLPKTSHSVMSTQQSINVPSVFHLTASQDGSKEVVPKIVESLSDTSQLMQLAEGISPQRKETQSSVANSCERLEMLSSGMGNDSSIHLSPGRTRAVAVVQPLSQKSYQVASKKTSPNTISKSPEDTAADVSLTNPEKLLISPNNKQDGAGVGSYFYLENPNQIRSSKSAIRHSAASNDGTILSSSDSAGPQDLSQTQLCADDMGSELAIDMQVDQCAAPTPQQSIPFNMPVSESAEKDESEMPTDPKEVSGLSSVPTTPWTLAMLNKLVQDGEKAQIELNDCAFPIRKLFSMFWDCNIKKLILNLKAFRCRNYLADTEKFCSEHETPDSVILSQVKSCFGKQLESYHVLRDNEVYSEWPYKSSWLNINEQLDDIDKDFDFPWSLKHRQHTLESDSQSDQVETDDNVPVQIASEVSNKMLSSTELEPVDLHEEKQDFTVEDISTQAASLHKVESADFSDPYSFEIQVLPPEEARVIFEQEQSKLPQSMDAGNRPERETNSPAEGELPNIIYAPLSDRKLENEPLSPIEEVCCIERLKEIIWGSDTSSLNKCQCKYIQSHMDVTGKTLVEEEVAVLMEDELCVIRSNSKFHSATEVENQAKGKQNNSDQAMTLELCNELSHTTDLTEDDDKPNSYSDKGPLNGSHRSINCSQSCVILISKNEDHLSSCENEIPNQIPDLENESSQSNGSDEKETKKISRSATEIKSDPEVYCVQDQLKFTGNVQSCTLDSNEKEIENLSSGESEVASQTSDLEEHSEAAQLISKSEEESSLESEEESSWENEEETEISVSGVQQTTWNGKHETVERKRKTLSSHDRFFPVLKKSKKFHVDADSQSVLEGASKCGKGFLDATDSEPSASNIRTVELVLFGSTPQDKCVLTGGRKSHASSPNAVFDKVSKPPEVLTVNLGPMKRKSKKSMSAWEYSIKQLYNKWRICLPQTEIRHRSKLKAQKCTSFGGQKAGKARSVNNEELPVSSERSVWNRTTKPCLTLKRRWSLSNGLKSGEDKMENHIVTLNQPADQERNEVENVSHADMPLQNNIVLKFSVLPNSFSFKDGSNAKETKDPVPDTSNLVEGKSHDNTVMRARGTWYSVPEKKCFSPPKTDSIFHEFQKKYKEKTLTTSINE